MADLEDLVGGAAAHLDRAAPRITVAEVLAHRAPAGLDAEVADADALGDLDPTLGPTDLTGARSRRRLALRAVAAVAAAAAVVVGLALVVRSRPDGGPAGPAPTTPATTAPAATAATATTATTATTGAPPATTAPATGEPVLTAGGIGSVIFFTPEESAVAALTTLLGPPLDAGAVEPATTATPEANGCINLAERVRFFPRGIAVGFAGGRFVAWTSWVQGFAGVGDALTPLEPSLPTSVGVRVGQTVAQAAAVAGDAFRAVQTSFPAARLATVDGVVSVGGDVLVVADHSGSASDGRIVLLTAGSACALPVQPDEVAPAVNWSRFGPGPDELRQGLDAVPRLVPTAVPASLGAPRRSEQVGQAPAAPSYVQVFAPATPGRLLQITTSVTPLGETGPPVFQLGPWRAYPITTADPSIAGLALTTDTGSILLWGQGIPTQQVRSYVSALRLRASGPGWDIGTPAHAPAVTAVFEGWEGGDVDRVLGWEGAGGGTSAVLMVGRFGLGAIGPSVGVTRTIVDVAGRRALASEIPGRIIVEWRASATVAVRLTTTGLTLDETLAMAASAAPVDAATWNAIAT